ncbi:hypothetical protein CONPUDRAFT_139435, partial [Coniophora puteana RWD-64-598 SS2]
DKNVPPPPDASHDALQRAIQGHNADQDWFVPVVVSDPHEDKDKAGQPSLVFDAVFNSSLKSRSLKDPQFKTFLIELAFQRIEAQTGLQLSRQISTPNIASKGKPLARQIQVPAALFPPGHPNHRKENDLIQEVTVPPVVRSTASQSLKSALKKPASTPASDASSNVNATGSASLQTPSFTWSPSGNQIRIAISVPRLTRALVASATLDLEPRRILLHIPETYALDLNLDAPDATLGNQPSSAESALSLKRARDFAVDTAKAEWRIADKALVIYA